ncbi:MAG: ComF family protein [Oscillospiraceae bacterium]|jgi:ComF family protein|nr:ComF family protein [Oscillospiraceae bacterium]
MVARSRLAEVLRFWGGRALDFLYPNDAVCAACSRPLADGAGGLCAECADELRPIEGARCRVCGRPLRETVEERRSFICSGCARRHIEERIEGAAPFSHEGTAARLVYALKYGGVRAAAEPLAREMARMIPERFEALTPVPLHRARQRERGFNQAAALCDDLARATDIPVIYALRRTAATRQQMKLGAAERVRNVQGAFEVVEPVEGMRIALVDDVRTTGMTALSCAKALYEAGAADVWLLTATVSVLNA